VRCPGPAARSGPWPGREGKATTGGPQPAGARRAGAGQEGVLQAPARRAACRQRQRDQGACCASPVAPAAISPAPARHVDHAGSAQTRVQRPQPHPARPTAAHHNLLGALGLVAHELAQLKRRHGCQLRQPPRRGAVVPTLCHRGALLCGGRLGARDAPLRAAARGRAPGALLTARAWRRGGSPRSGAALAAASCLWRAAGRWGRPGRARVPRVAKAPTALACPSTRACWAPRWARGKGLSRLLHSSLLAPDRSRTALLACAALASGRPARRAAGLAAASPGGGRGWLPPRRVRGGAAA
jgi:hypothetical protein